MSQVIKKEVHGFRVLSINRALPERLFGSRWFVIKVWDFELCRYLKFGFEYVPAVEELRNMVLAKRVKFFQSYNDKKAIDTLVGKTIEMGTVTQ